MKSRIVPNAEQCPFCGAGLGMDENFLLCDVSEVEISDEYGRIINRKKLFGAAKVYAVICQNCGAIGPMQTSQKKALRDWNRE